MAAKRKSTGLLAYMDAQVASLHENVAAGVERFDADAVHDARVATRRLAAAIQLLEPVLGKSHRKSVTKGLKRLRRLLGPLREADVMIDHLAGLSGQRRLQSAIDWLINRIESSRLKLRAIMSKEVDAAKQLRRLEDWPLVRFETAEASEAIDTLVAESLHLQLEAFAEQASRLAVAFGPATSKNDPGAALHGSFPRAGAELGEASTGNRQDPHDVRIAGKALRYTLEMAAEQGRSPGKRLMRTFKRMQDQLGSWHDWVVLGERGMRETLDAQLALHQPAVAQGMLEFSRFAFGKAAMELKAFARLWQGQGERLLLQVRSAYPLTRPVEVTDDAERSAPAEKLPEAASAEKPPELPPTDSPDESENAEAIPDDVTAASDRDGSQLAG